MTCSPATIAGRLTVADFMLYFQVTQKYLEHLISQRQYSETAEACAKLLKVSLAITAPSTRSHNAGSLVSCHAASC